VRRWAWVILLSLLLLGLQARLWFADGGLREASSLRKAIAAQTAENQRIDECNARLRAELRDLESGKEALEERARYDLGMILPDELYVQLINDPASENQTTPSIAAEGLRCGPGS
jgi:cell division protein FtsB